MNELPLVLLVFAVVLGLIILVGHGLWLLLAALFRLVAGESEPRRDSVRCAFCGSPVAAGAARCDWCNHRVQRSSEKELADLEAVRRQLRRWREAGQLKPRTAERLSARLAQYRRERFATALDGQAAAAETTPQPTRPAPTAAPAVPRAVEPPVQPEVVEAELVQETPAQAPTLPPAEPGRPWQEVVAGFLADRDIHWAELIGVLVGGFIMVGSSLALVVNLWQTLEQTPYLKFFVFVAYTSVVFAAGLYAFHRWKLRSTGGGLLVIGMLLVPLDFLAMASLWRAGLGHGAIVAEVAGLAIFLVLIRLAAAAMTPNGRWFPPLAIVGNSAVLLGVARFVQPGRPYWFLALAAGVPVAVFAGAMGGYLLRVGRKTVLRPSEAAALLIVLSTAGFALCVAVGLYVNQAAAVLGNLAAALNLLAAPMALAAVPVLAVGVRLMRVADDDARDAEPAIDARSIASYVAAGTLVALAAVLLQLAALGLAWPEPSALVAVGLLNAVGLLLVAFRNGFPLAHAGAMACAGLSYLVGFHWLLGNLAGIAPAALDTELLKLAVSGQSGTALGGMFVAFALASLLLKRMPERRHGEMYAAGSAVVAVIGLMLVTYHGFDAGGADAFRAAALYAVYGAGSLALAALWRDRQFAYLGTPLIAAAPLWALWASTGELAPIAATLLAGEALLAAVVAFALGRGRSPSHAASPPDVFRLPLIQTAEVLAVLAAGLWVVTAWTHRAAIDHVLPPVATTAVLAVFYFAGAWMHRTGWRVRVPRGLSRFSRDKGQFAQSTIRKRRENGTVPLATIWRTWAGSLVVLAGLTHALALNFTGTVEHPWLIAPLVHASVGLLAALAMDGVGRGRARLRRRLTPGFANPLAESALLSSVLLLVVLPHLWQTNWTFAGGLFWLAALWLTFAVRSGNRFVFGTHQAMLAVAAVAAVTVRLDAVLPDLAEQWFKPAQLQLYGIAVVAVLLPWPVLRVLGRGKRHVGWVVPDVSASGFTHAPSGSAPRNGRADSCEASGGPSRKTGPVPSSPQTGYLRNWADLLGMDPGVDGVLRHALVALQFLLAALWLAPELARELGLPVGPMAEGVHDVGAAGGWVLVGLLAAGLIVELWHRWGRAELAAALVLAGTVPWLLAGRVVDQVAAASALRWTAAGLFLGASALVWCRGGLGRLARAAAMRGKRDRSDLCEAPEGPSRQIGPVPFSPPDLCEAPEGPSRQIGPVPFSPVHVAQAGLLIFGLLPVIVPTILAVALRFDYVTPRGPLAESPFFAIGPNANNLVPLALVAATLVGWAIRQRSAGYALGSILLANLVGLVAWQAWGPVGLDGLLPAQVFAMAGAAMFWTAMRLLLPERTPPLPAGDAAPNHVAALAGVGFILLLAAAGALGAISGEYRLAVDRLDAFAWLAAAAATAFCLLDPTARFPIASLYFLGLAAVGFGLNYRNFDPREYIWTSAPELAGAMLGAGVVGWLFARLRAKIAEPPVEAASDSPEAARVPQPGGRQRLLAAVAARLSDAASFPPGWFHACQAVLGAVAASLALWVSFDIQNDGVGLGTALFGLAGRWAGPPTALMLLGAAIAMAWQAADSRPRASERGSRRMWQMAAFGAGFLLNLTVGLAALDATSETALGEALWLNRCAVLLVGAAMLTLLSRFGLKGALPRSGDWLDVGREVSPVFAALTALTLPILLVLEVLAFEPEAGAPVARFSVVAIAVLLVLLAAGCLAHALRAGRAAGERGFTQPSQPTPTMFVYAAEAIVATAALHVWLCEPQWFRLGFVEQYWMFLVMAVAFAGVGVSEWFHRAGVPVLSEPLRNTAVVLPVVPMTGFWFMAPPGSLLGLTGSTPALWLLMALFYGYLAAMKPASVLYAALTLLTASVGLWVLLDRQQLDFFTHPQLWLIPPALAMLIAERVNRPRLGRRQREALRYVGLSVIYVASTTEFMRGVGDSIWLPLVLLGLSVAGVLAGVALRIRSYIYLGMTFLAVVIVRMIVYAAFEQGQMWLFWVCCILLGAAIIVLFAVFERRRNELAAAVEKFRQWEG